MFGVCHTPPCANIALRTIHMQLICVQVLCQDIVNCTSQTVGQIVHKTY